ncbi:hypothetical protein CHI10_21920 [Bacillus sp. 7894-2]|nr:hypothetical protein CHI10_21920 [Bacillus sp. 7894-2]
MLDISNVQIPRSVYYYEVKDEEDPIVSNVVDIFHASRQNYGTRKIKVELKKRGLIVSRRRIGRIMQEQGLVSSYTIAQFNPHAKSCNESEQKNELNRAFTQEQEMTIIVSDLTYLRVNQKWNYVCVFVELFNREIIGFSTVPNKDALLVYRAIASKNKGLNLGPLKR